MMTNKDIVNLLRHVAAAYAIKDEKKYRFQIIAYQKAADALESTTTEVKTLVIENKLQSIPGIGPSIKQHLEELIETGKVKHFETVLGEVPAALFPLLDVPTFGPKKSFKLVTHFKLSNPDTVLNDLQKIAESGAIAQLEGFGEKSQQDILRALVAYKTGLTKSVRMNLPYATELANKILEYLKKSPAVLEAYPLGSLRRKRDTIGDVDIAVSTEKPVEVLEHFVKYPYKEQIIEKGDVSAGLIVSGGKHIDLMVMPPDKFGSLLQHFTGSKNHNVHLREYALKKGLSLSERGIKDIKSEKLSTFRTEKEFYNYLGLDWIPPEIREDTGEIERALLHTLPKLIEKQDIKGDFHLHSSFPIEPSHDLGKNTIEEMVQKAVQLRYSYISFSEHNPSTSKHTEKEIVKLIKDRNKEIERVLNINNNVHIFCSMETDILPDGSLALPEMALELLDFSLVSIHSVFSMDREQMTERVLKGLSHPKAKILTHPSGRLINQRAGYEVNWDKLLSFCREHNKALEINAYPSRLDLTDEIVRKAVEHNVMLVISTDSHATEHMDLMEYGVSVARRGWATKLNILNTKTYNEIVEWIQK